MCVIIVILIIAQWVTVTKALQKQELIPGSWHFRWDFRIWSCHILPMCTTTEWSWHFAATASSQGATIPCAVAVLTWLRVSRARHAVREGSRPQRPLWSLLRTCRYPRSPPLKREKRMPFWSFLSSMSQNQFERVCLWNLASYASFHQSPSVARVWSRSNNYLG